MTHEHHGHGGGRLALPVTADGRPILRLDDLDRQGRPRRAGGRLRYYCPVHGGDRQRSLSVDPASGLYYCHCCGATGRLRDHWEGQHAGGSGPRRDPTEGEEARSRARRVALERADRDRLALLSSPAPPAAARFLARLPALTRALRAPGSPGAAYLRGRGLDPILAAAYGVGYAGPGVWPGDDPDSPGRLVYPLADPCTGRATSALGRACAADDARRTHRKLSGCPAGIWPLASYARAVACRDALVLVEGPADALALLACPESPPVAALGGTRLPVPLAALRHLSGVVLAVDDDPSGRAASARLVADLAALGVPRAALPPGWLGGAPDPADLARAATRDPMGPAAAAWLRAVDRVREAARSLGSRD